MILFRFHKGPYDTIIVDPPSFQKNSFIAKNDYGKIIRRIPELLTENGNAQLCLNAPELDTAWLKEQVTHEAPELEFIERLPNPDAFPSLHPERALKVMVFQKK
jgi:23S rRNA (cytosine1962-C5)-methyltransferase